MSIYVKEILAIYMAFKEFGHIFWGANQTSVHYNRQQIRHQILSNKDDSSTSMDCL